MCLLIFAHRASRKFPLLVAANRDEFHQRPTAASGFWPQHPTVLAGRDEQSGGTWMGVTRDRKFAAVTNFRDPATTDSAPRSRGELPLDYLLGSQSPESYLREVSLRAERYAGFNLLLGDGDALWYFCNQAQPGASAIDPPRALDPGIYGLSNAHLDTPWPKVQIGKRGMDKMISDSGPVDHDSLLELVSNTELAEREALVALDMTTPMEQLLSAQFIRSQTYGTRSSTTLSLSSEGQTSWRELSFDSDGNLRESQEQTFQRC